MTSERKPVKVSGVLLGSIVVWFPAAPIVLGLAFAIGPWYLWLLAFPGLSLLVLVIGGLATVIRGHRMITTPLAALGLLAAVAAGIGLIWFGIMVNVENAPCDPAVSRCVTVINGVASGESTESTGSQRFGTFLLSLVAIGPGLLILGVTARTAIKAVRKRPAPAVSDVD